MKLVLLVLGLALAAFLAYVQTRSDRLHVERSATIAAPSEAIFPHVDELRRWTAWSPYEKRDPQMQRTYEGPAAGVGASYHWSGNNDVGEGTARITESTPGRKIGIALDFLRPFKASNVATFTFAPDGAGTRVTWAMDGANGFMSKLMGTFIDLDKMIGNDFEQGLASLKGIAESAAVAR